jgi:hypothetical protein
VLGVEDFDLPGRVNVWLLFTGGEPFQVTIATPTPQDVWITPTAPRGRAHQVLLARWWRAWQAQTRSHGDYPPVVETYLTELLSSRLDGQTGRQGSGGPLAPAAASPPMQSELSETVDLLLGTERLRLAVLRDMMRSGRGPDEAGGLPVPTEVSWSAQTFAVPAGDVEVEPIARHVSPEWFYVRFGSFQNYVWFDHLKDDYAGNLGQMVTLRGHNARLDEKTQAQLGLRQTAAGELFGGQVIEDVALVGRDLYVREGAALGILFLASNHLALSASLHGDRQAILAAERRNGATLETVEIAGREVSLLSTPDNRVRSFYAVDGRAHFVTTCREMVERFFEAGNGSLATSPDFLHARTVMPVTREDTIFAYFSPAFFRGLLTPHYQIELIRRLQSVARMELLELARRAALAEQAPGESVAELVAGGFLPESFQNRADESLPPMGQWPVDPIRGARGTFAPIPDVPLTSVTPAELARWQRCAGVLQSRWTEMDPLMVGIKRYALDGDRMERIVIDGNVSPLVEKKYGWLLSLVGPPTDVVLQSDPTDVVTAQMSLQGGLLWPAVLPHHLFLGVQDSPAGGELIPRGFWRSWELLRTAPGYIGAWPQLGLLDLIPGIATPPDPAGFSQLPLGLWRWQGNGFSVLSFRPDVLSEAAAHLQPVPATSPAQFRLRVAELTHSRRADWLTVMNFDRAWQTSLGTVGLLHTLSQQLRIPPDESRTVAQHLLGTSLVCTLGGAYELRDDGGVPRWVSTAWPVEGQLPAGYQAPLLEWFRGASIDFTRREQELILHAEIDMQRKERDPPVELPLFRLFPR